MVHLLKISACELSRLCGGRGEGKGHMLLGFDVDCLDIRSHKVTCKVPCKPWLCPARLGMIINYRNFFFFPVPLFFCVWYGPSPLLFFHRSSSSSFSFFLILFLLLLLHRPFPPPHPGTPPSSAAHPIQLLLLWLLLHPTQHNTRWVTGGLCSSWLLLLSLLILLVVLSLLLFILLPLLTYCCFPSLPPHTPDTSALFTWIYTMYKLVVPLMYVATQLFKLKKQKFINYFSTLPMCTQFNILINV